MVTQIVRVQRWGHQCSTHDIAIANFSERFRWARRLFQFHVLLRFGARCANMNFIFRLCRIFQYPATTRYSHAQILFVRGSSFMFSDFGLITHCLLALNKRIYFLSVSVDSIVQHRDVTIWSLAVTCSFGFDACRRSYGLGATIDSDGGTNDFEVWR